MEGTFYNLDGLVPKELTEELTLGKMKEIINILKNEYGYQDNTIIYTAKDFPKGKVHYYTDITFSIYADGNVDAEVYKWDEITPYTTNFNIFKVKLVEEKNYNSYGIGEKEKELYKGMLDSLDLLSVILAFLFDRMDYNNKIHATRAPKETSMESIQELYEKAGDSMYSSIDSVSIEDYINYEETIKEIRNKLSAGQIKVFDLLLDGCSCEEISKILGKPASTIRSQKNKIKKLILPIIKKNYNR